MLLALIRLQLLWRAGVYHSCALERCEGAEGQHCPYFHRDETTGGQAMSRREGLRKYQIFAIMVLGLWLPCQVMAADIDVFVGYADNVRPSPFFPSPWLGDPGILDVGHALGLIFDAGAILIDNNTGAALTIERVTVDGFGNGASFSLWGAFTIPSGMKAILTQTTLEENFDTSDQFLPGHECCTPLGNGVEPFP